MKIHLKTTKRDAFTACDLIRVDIVANALIDIKNVTCKRCINLDPKWFK